MTDSRTTERIQKMSLWHIITIEMKSMLPHTSVHTHDGENLSKGHKSQLKELPMLKVGTDSLSNKINNMVLT